MDQSLLLVGSHGLVLFYVMRFQASTMKEIATSLGLTERRIAVVISDLVDANYLEVQKLGRRNRYSINTRASFRHPTMSHVHLSDFERLLFPDRQPARHGTVARQDSWGFDRGLNSHSRQSVRRRMRQGVMMRF